MLILSGDQLYQMDYRKMLERHRGSGADATVAVTVVSEAEASAFGILKIDRDGRIVHFEEKPTRDRLPELASDIPGIGKGYLASMGIYAFNRSVLEVMLTNSESVDFGRHIIPEAINRLHVQSFVYKGYWEDVGTIKSYFQANLALTDDMPPFDFYQANAPIFTNPRFLPASKVKNCELHDTLVSEGCIIQGAKITRSVIGIRSRIGQGTHIKNSLLLGADFYETLFDLEGDQAHDLPAIGVGDDCIIENAILDKNSRIGKGVRIVNEAGVHEKDGKDYFIREGIVIVKKGGIIPDGTVI